MKKRQATVSPRARGKDDKDKPDGRRAKVTFVIMAGGKGERLWPLVRSAMPKVCLSPDGTQSLLEATLSRLQPVWPGADWLIVTTKEQAHAVRGCLSPRLRGSVLVEPKIKNTAACITLAAVALAIRDPKRVMVVVPADHWVGEADSFRRSVREAIHQALARDALATIGVRPKHPHPGLGYLCAGSPLAGAEGSGVSSAAPRVFRLARFIEKPTLALARRLTKRSRTYWNIGIFIGTADKFLECITEWLPDHVRRLMPLARSLRDTNGRYGAGAASFALRAATAYRTLEPVSFDHGVMDHVDEGLIVEGRFLWADLGSWETWARLGKSQTRLLEVESRNVTVVGQRRHLVAAIGVSDLVVVQTASATLICRADQTQAVREVVRRIATDPQLKEYR